VRWEEPSLCEGWTVHDVVAHLVDTARTTRLGRRGSTSWSAWPGCGSTSTARTPEACSATAVRPHRRRCSGSGTSHHAGPLLRRRWTAGSSRRSLADGGDRSAARPVVRRDLSSSVVGPRRPAGGSLGGTARGDQCRGPRMSEEPVRGSAADGLLEADGRGVVLEVAVAVDA
jgi:hypothetical protein